MSIPQARTGEPTRCRVEDLLLDAENPRIAPSASPRSQQELVELLATDYSLLEIGRSIADNGFFEEEPLAAVSQGSSDPPYTVIEGNRRLASLKLLADDALRRTLAPRLRAEMAEWRALAASMTTPVLDVPVVMYQQREQLLTFMGFRHITGVQPWDPLAKARFVNSLIEDYGMDFRTAALRIGSKPAHVKRSYLGYRTYLQAGAAGIDTSSVENAYGVFTRAMYSAPLKAHVGITSTREGTENPAKLKQPVPAKMMSELGELVSWVAGTQTQPAVINDSRQITELGNVVASPDALGLLRATRDLARSAELTSGPQRRVIAGLERALGVIESVRRDVAPGLANAEVLGLASRVEEAAGELRRAVEHAASAG
jgi:hypothetical protein